MLLLLFCLQAVLEVYFQRYSLPSEMFTDEGLIALTEGCRSLKRLTLHNCDRVSDRCGHAAATAAAAAACVRGMGKGAWALLAAPVFGLFSPLLCSVDTAA